PPPPLNEGRPGGVDGPLARAARARILSRTNFKAVSEPGCPQPESLLADFHFSRVHPMTRNPGIPPEPAKSTRCTMSRIILLSVAIPLVLLCGAGGLSCCTPRGDIPPAIDPNQWAYSLAAATAGWEPPNFVNPPNPLP